jgi:hypothetical protein
MRMGMVLRAALVLVLVVGCAAGAGLLCAKATDAEPASSAARVEASKVVRCMVDLQDR